MKAVEVLNHKNTIGLWLVGCSLTALSLIGIETFDHEGGEISVGAFVAHLMNDHGILVSIGAVLFLLGLGALFPETVSVMTESAKKFLKSGGAKTAGFLLAPSIAGAAVLHSDPEVDPGSLAAGQTASTVALAALDRKVAASTERLSDLSSQVADLRMAIQDLPTSADLAQLNAAAPAQVEQLDRHMLARFASIERQLSELRAQNTEALRAEVSSEISAQVVATNRQLCLLVAAIREAGTDVDTDSRLAELEGRIGSLKFYEEELAGRNVFGRVADFFTGRNLEAKERQIKGASDDNVSDAREHRVAESEPVGLAEIAPAAGAPGC